MCINKNVLIELCVSNYATTNDLVNEIDKIFKTSMTYNNINNVSKTFNCNINEKNKIKISK